MTDVKNFEGEIQDVIARNLPAHVSSVLQSRLQDATKFESQYNTEKSLKEKAVKLADERLDELTQLKKVLARHEEIEKREKAVLDRELRLDIELAKKDTACAQAVVGKYDFLMGVIFKNPTYREMAYKGGMQNVNGMSIPLNETTTRTVERD